MRKGGEAKGMPAAAIQLIPTIDREAVKVMCQMTDYLDLIIPRGGEGLINAVTEMAHVPVIKHYKGVCHTYIDATADLDMAWRIAENAKCQSAQCGGNRFLDDWPVLSEPQYKPRKEWCQQYGGGH